MWDLISQLEGREAEVMEVVVEPSGMDELIDQMGDLYLEDSDGKYLDRTGSVFGCWEVTSPGPEREWIVRCADCGSVYKKSLDLLLKKPGKCPACVSGADLFGKKVGHLTLMESKGREIFGECDCGGNVWRHIKDMRRHLREGTGMGKPHTLYDSTVSCGGDKHLPDPDPILRRRLRVAYRKGAQERGLVFKLTQKAFDDLVGRDCHYCGVEPSNRYRVKTKKLADFKLCYSGIDRQDSSKGYTVENCVPCCWVCNRGKKDLPLSEWEDYLARVAEKVNKDMDA